MSPTHATFLIVWNGAGGVRRPTTSTLNAPAGHTVANSLAIDMIGNGGKGNPLEHFTSYGDRGLAHVILDVTGAFETYPPFASGGSLRAYEQPHLAAVAVARG